MKLIVTFLLTLVNLDICAQWSSSSSVNNAVCNFSSNQLNVQMISDGAGGAICTWVDTRNGTQDIYAQQIDAAGNLQWNVDGIAICNAVSDQYSPKLVSDGNGGAIIVWYDNRDGNWDIYTQRINASGIVQWTTDGVAICTVAGNQNAQQVMADGAGGAIIVWSDGRVGGPNADIYVQRINSAGTVQWAAEGAAVCTAASLQNIPQLVSDGSGGAIIVWEDWRNFSQTDIYAQRISSNGFTNWSFNGVIICSEPNFAHQFSSRIVSDGSGGAIICWEDKRNFGTNSDIYAQRINFSGTVQWLNNGLAVCTASGLQIAQQMVPDGSGGAIIAWEDRRTGRDIYAQRINTSGAIQWLANGIAVCNTPETQEEPQMIARVSGGAILLWTDSRNTFQQDIYAQAIDAAGAAIWAANGVPVANESHSQFAAQLIPGSGDAAIIAWEDLRSTTDYDIYSSKLFSNGTLPVHLLDFTLSNALSVVTLQWKTGNEFNNRGFEIQRSSNGTDWRPIGFVEANTTGTGIKDYRWEDNSPLSGKSYYRLNQIDNDGKFEYSKVLSVNRSSSAMVTIYPNPVKGLLNINFGRMINNAKLQLYNNSGQLILTQVIASQSSLQVNVKNISAGIYTLYLKSGEGDAVCRFMIE